MCPELQFYIVSEDDLGRQSKICVCVLLVTKLRTLYMLGK